MSIFIEIALGLLKTISNIFIIVQKVSQEKPFKATGNSAKPFNLHIHAHKNTKTQTDPSTHMPANIR